MGMTRQTSGIYAFLRLQKDAQDYQAIIALAGNPNTGKARFLTGSPG